MLLKYPLKSVACLIIMSPPRSYRAVTLLIYSMTLLALFSSTFTIALLSPNPNPNLNLNPRDPTSSSLFDMNDSLDDRIATGININANDLNLMPSSITTEDSDWTLFISQPSFNQNAAEIVDETSSSSSSSPFIQTGDDLIPPTEFSLAFLQDQNPNSDLNLDLDSHSNPDLLLLSLNSNSNSKPIINSSPSPSGPTSPTPNNNKPPRLDFWNTWPFSCTFKWGSQAVCCDGAEDDQGVRHGCGRTMLNSACDDPSHRFCCALADRTYFTRTWCVVPPAEDG